jgi:hypothetical protein
MHADVVVSPKPTPNAGGGRLGMRGSRIASAQPDIHPLAPIFHSRSVAVVGVCSQPGREGMILPTLMGLGYHDLHALYPVNPKMSEVQGLRCYPTLVRNSTRDTCDCGSLNRRGDGGATRT